MTFHTAALGLAFLSATAPLVRAQCEVSEVHPLDGGFGDRFGASVAISNDFALVGSVFHDGIGSNSGAAYILHRQPDGSWASMQKLTASDEALDDRFGFVVDIDGTSCVVGARYNADLGYGSGSIYIYDFNGTSWNESAYLVASDETIGSLFGASVGISRNAVITGAPVGHDTVFQQGVAYIKERSAGTWGETARLVQPAPGIGDRFGQAVDVHVDGTGARAIVGASNVDTSVVDGGAAFIYEKIGGVWTYVAELLPSVQNEGAFFGGAVKIEGDVAVVGALLEDNTFTDAGAVYVFERIDGSWTQTARLTPASPEDGGLFGASIGLDGRRALIGAWASDGGRGDAFLFEDTGSGWNEVSRYPAVALAEGDHFGIDVDLDGDHAIVGARNSQSSGGTNTGGAHIFEELSSYAIVGEGCVGAGGFVPRLEPFGCVAVDELITLSLRRGAGGALSILAASLDVGNFPLPSGCIVNIDLPFLLSIGPIPLTGAFDGTGELDLTFPVPAGLPPVDVSFQAFIKDPGVPGLVVSNGLTVSIAGT